LGANNALFKGANNGALKFLVLFISNGIYYLLFKYIKINFLL